MFTFLTFSYNQESFIIEHLESIKYQIEHYGDDVQCEFILCDDSSSDQTILFAEEWLSVNASLFKKTAILFNIENQGIVKNFLRGINAIGTNNFKHMAADDLYYKHEVFKTNETFDLVLTPLLYLDPMYRVTDRVSDLSMYLLSLSKIDTKQKIMQGKCHVNAPSTFINVSLLKSTEYQDFLLKFKWIEDAPTWYYLLKNKFDISIEIKQIPLIIYRVSCGISKNHNHQQYLMFKKEEAEINRIMGKRLSRLPNILNPYKYIEKIRYEKLERFDSKHDLRLMEYVENMQRELHDAQKYVALIKTKAEEFRIKYLPGS